MSTIVSVSMPEELRYALDAEAERRSRSRSFVVAEAVREYLARSRRDAVEEARLRTLREALELTPEERVRLSEELWRELASWSRVAEPWAGTFSTFAAREAHRRRRKGLEE